MPPPNQQPQPPSAEALAFHAWRSQEETQRFFRYLRDLREQSKEDWASRQFVLKTDQESTANNYEALGSVATLQDLLGLTNETIEEFYHAKHNEPVRHSS